MNTSNSKRNTELYALGEVTRAYGGERIAVDVARDGGDLADMIRRLYSRTWREDGLAGLDRAAGVRLDARDLERYSTTRAIHASLRKISGWTAPRPNPFDANSESERRLVEADRASSCYELELSTELQRQSGWAANGFALPWSVLQRDFNVGTGSQAGNVVGTDKRVDLTPDAARPALALQRLGVTVLGGFRASFEIPTMVSDQSGASFLTEVASATEGQPGSGLVTFSPARASAFIEVSKQALFSAPQLMDRILIPTMRDNLFSVIENAVINGSGSGGAPLGVRNVSGIGTVVAGTNGAAPAWSHFLDLEQLPAAANAPESARGGYLINSKTRRLLKSTAKGTNLGFLWDGGAQPLNGYNTVTSNNVPSNLTKGTSTTVCSSALFGSDWSELVLAVFGQPDVVVDPYTKSDQGLIRLHLSAYVAPGVLRPSGFSKVDDLLS